MAGRETRPPIHDPATWLLYEWLAANGVAEWLPDDPLIVVDGDRITFTAFAWIGPPGWDCGNIHPNGDTVTRTVPMRVPPSPDVARVLTELEPFARLRHR